MLLDDGRGESLVLSGDTAKAVVVQVGEVGESRRNPTLGVQTITRFLQRNG